MAFNHNKKLANDYCGTAYAAKILGLSVGTIQALVEKNELQAWRTQGGHRRISMHSIHEFLNKNNMKGIPIETQDTRLRVLIVDDDAISRDLLRGYFEKSDFPVDFAIMQSGLYAGMLLDHMRQIMAVIEWALSDGVSDLGMCRGCIEEDQNGPRFVPARCKSQLFLQEDVLLFQQAPVKLGMGFNELLKFGGGLHIAHSFVDVAVLAFDQAHALHLAQLHAYGAIGIARVIENLLE